MLSMHQEHRKRLVDYTIEQDAMIELARAQSFEPDEDAPETYSFLRFPRLKEPTIRWTETLGDRVKVIPFSSIKDNPVRTVNTLLNWLELPEMPTDTELPRHNESGGMNQSAWARVLREPPRWLASLAKLLLPTKGLRRAVLDPIRAPGFKPKPYKRPALSEQTRKELETAFAEEIEFQANLSQYIDTSLTIDGQ